MGIGAFIQYELLGMRWLNRLVALLLEKSGVDLAGHFGGALHFFIYDCIKIMLLLAVLIFAVSYIQSYFPPERSKKILGRFGRFTATVAAALLGTVTPFCSCSSIPLFIGFTAAGLPLSVTFSFLISSPMVDLGSLVLLVSVFGWKIAVAYVVLGLVIAIAGGNLIGMLGFENCVEEYVREAKLFDTEQTELSVCDRADFALQRMFATARKLFPYVLAGVAIGAVIHNWIPKEFIVRLLGSGGHFGIVLATLAGIPVYADIFGTIPVAEALLAKGASLGVVLSFMMAVTTLSLPSLIMLREVIKPKLLSVFVAICACGIITVGWIFNQIQNFLIF